jgi:nitrate/nitrite transporter NarK
MTLRPLPDLFGNCGGFKRVYGGNLSARVGYCEAVWAAVGAGTTVEVVDVLVDPPAVVFVDGVVVVVESFAAACACTPSSKELQAISIAKLVLLKFCILFFEKLSLA